jgi:hypothetical protein
MSNEHENRPADPDALRQVQQTLASFAPQAIAVDRDRLMFLAGMASAVNLAPNDTEALNTQYAVLSTGSPAQKDRSSSRTQSWHWPAATATLAATSLALLATLILRAAPEPQIVYRDREVPVPVQPQVERREADAVDAKAVPLRLVKRTETAPPVVPANNYVRSRDVALSMGLDAIGSPGASGTAYSAPATYRDWLLEFTGDSSSPTPAPSPPSSPNM